MKIRFLNQKNRSILREMVVTDFKVRYQGSALGYAWTLLRPLFLFAVLYVVFTQFLKIGEGIPNYPVYLLLGIVLWQFFAEATNNGMTSVVQRGDLIKKISIPRYLVVVSGTLSALINLTLNMLVVMVFILVSGVDITKTWLLAPFIIAELYILAISLGFFLSALFVKYRDASYVWEVILQAGFYATPILYPLTLLSDRLQQVLLLSPVAQIIQDMRWALISNDTATTWSKVPSPYYLIPVLFIIFIIIVSVFYFKSQAKYFAERI